MLSDFLNLRSHELELYEKISSYIHNDPSELETGCYYFDLKHIEGETVEVTFGRIFDCPEHLLGFAHHEQFGAAYIGVWREVDGTIRIAFVGHFQHAFTIIKNGTCCRSIVNKFEGPRMPYTKKEIQEAIGELSFSLHLSKRILPA